MDKPKKIKDTDKPDIEGKELFDLYKNGYNRACDKWEKYHKQEIKTLCDWNEEFVKSLPSEEEIMELINKDEFWEYDFECAYLDEKKLAKTISERIRG